MDSAELYQLLHSIMPRSSTSQSTQCPSQCLSPMW